MCFRTFCIFSSFGIQLSRKCGWAGSELCVRTHITQPLVINYAHIINTVSWNFSFWENLHNNKACKIQILMLCSWYNFRGDGLFFDSNHKIVTCKLKSKLKVCTKRHKGERFNITALLHPTTARRYCQEFRSSAKALRPYSSDNDKWEQLKQTVKAAASKILGKTIATHKP